MTEHLLDFASPLFRPEDGLVQIKRSVRDLKLVERGNGFELRGKRVVELIVGASAIQVRLARTLALTPLWDVVSIRSVADQRRFIDEIEKRLARWAQDE